MGGCEPIIDGVPGGVRPQFEGVPNSLLARVRGPLNVEHFLGVETASRSAQDYLTAGGTTSAGVNPASGDTVSRGLWNMTVVPGGAAVGGQRRQNLDVVGADGFGSDWPTLWAIRFQVNSAEPTAATYNHIAGGLYHVASSTALTPNDGVCALWDPSLGTPSWVVRCVRSGSGTTDSVPLAQFDNDFHTVGFLHTGNDVIPFFDGQVFAAITGVNVQPNDAITSRVLHQVTAAGGAVTADATTDFVVWG